MIAKQPQPPAPPHQVTPPLLYTQEQLITMLGLREQGIQNPDRTIKRYRDTGRLKGSRIGYSYVYTPKAIEDFLRMQEK